jgi:hypothetical protein
VGLCRRLADSTWLAEKTGGCSDWPALAEAAAVMPSPLAA